MPFVKLDTQILTSSLWTDRLAREVFITALLLCEPHEIRIPTPSIKIRIIEPDGFLVPPGWYGFARAAGSGILQQAGLEDRESGLDALERLAAPEADSRSLEHQGRRMVRIDGGFIILNYDRYRSRDHTNAERQKRYRQRLVKVGSSNALRDVTVTQAEAEVEEKKKAALRLPLPGVQGAEVVERKQVKIESGEHPKVESQEDIRSGALFDNEKPPAPAPATPPPPEKPRPVDSLEFTQAWNSLGKPFATIRDWGEPRKRSFKVRACDPFFIENWHKALAKMRESNFCKGHNDRTWIANLEFFLRPATVVKLMEGAYDFANKGSKQKNMATLSTIDDPGGEVYVPHKIPQPGDPDYIPW